MPANRDKNLKGFLLFWMEHSNAVSKDNETAKAYLKEQGKDPDVFANDLLKKIKKKQLEINAATTSLEFQTLKNVRDKAIQKAKDLLTTPGFSFLDFMKQEKFALQNRSLESLDENEIQNILEDYLFLKMQQEKSDESSDS